MNQGFVWRQRYICAILSTPRSGNAKDTRKKKKKKDYDICKKEAKVSLTDK